MRASSSHLYNVTNNCWCRHRPAKEQCTTAHFYFIFINILIFIFIMGKLVIGTVIEFEDKGEFMQNVIDFAVNHVIIHDCPDSECLSFDDLRSRLHHSNTFCPKRTWDESNDDEVDAWMEKVQRDTTFSDCIEFLRLFGAEYLTSIEQVPFEELFRDDLNETFVSFKE